MLAYHAYITHYVDAAVQAYKAKTGQEPTVIIARPDYDLIGEHPAIIKTRFAAYGMICLSHLLTQEEINHLKLSTTKSMLIEFHSDADARRPTITDADLEANSLAVHKAPQGRPVKGGGDCPHCHQHISDFESLGWWYGWALGIEPPYWEELRRYVFRRDNHTCRTCHKSFPPGGLECHHIQRKEDGGADSARNLMTLCHEHHLDNKPIMPDEN